jgi:hypothetical protein
MKQKSKILILLILILGTLLPLVYANAGTITSPYKYAWSDQVGYINFAPVNGGVTVTNSALSGYAWSENSGYINFAPAQGGVSNDGNGNLSGSAWGENLGYIDFNNVSINTTTGKFSGTATGPVIGTLTFDCAQCDVRTDWGVTVSSGGSGGGGKRPVDIILNPVLNETSPVQQKADDVCSIYMYKYIKLGEKNDPNEVKKLQVFLRDYEDFADLSVTGVYNQITYEAVKKFQTKYSGEVLAPWGTSKPTGYVYQTTLKKINEIYCKNTSIKKNSTQKTTKKETIPTSSPAGKNSTVKEPIKQPVQEIITIQQTTVKKTFIEKVIDLFKSIIFSIF